MVDAQDAGPEHDPAGPVGVDHRPDRQGGHALSSPGTDHSEVVQGDGSSLPEADRPPDASRIPPVGPALGGSGPGPFLVRVADRWAGHLDGK